MSDQPATPRPIDPASAAGPATPGYETHDGEPVCAKCLNRPKVGDTVVVIEGDTVTPVATVSGVQRGPAWEGFIADEWAEWVEGADEVARLAEQLFLTDMERKYQAARYEELDRDFRVMRAEVEYLRHAHWEMTQEAARQRDRRVGPELVALLEDWDANAEDDNYSKGQAANDLRAALEASEAS